MKHDSPGQELALLRRRLAQVTKMIEAWAESKNPSPFLRLVALEQKLMGMIARYERMGANGR